MPYQVICRLLHIFRKCGRFTVAPTSAVGMQTFIKTSAFDSNYVHIHPTQDQKFGKNPRIHSRKVQCYENPGRFSQNMLLQFAYKLNYGESKDSHKLFCKNLKWIRAALHKFLTLHCTGLHTTIGLASVSLQATQKGSRVIYVVHSVLPCRFCQSMSYEFLITCT